MSKRTPIYSLLWMQLGDKWYPGFDQDNMITAENELSALYRFIGPGVITGWDVTSMALTGNQAIDAAIIAARSALANSPAKSLLNQQWVALGSPAVNDNNAWSQIIQVSPGAGIVDVYTAKTSYSYYFRYQVNNIYYVYAAKSYCLQTEGIAAIVAPLDPSIDYTTINASTYLATVEIATNESTNLPFILSITYENSRNNLKDLASALQAALQASFYHHVHLGGPNHPSKILLSTEIVLNATGPLGSTIFILVDSNNNPFTWSASAYGIPQVRLNNIPLPSSSYDLIPSSGKLFLKNSIEPGSVLQVVLPLSPQISLTIQPSYNLESSTIYLTDGVTNPGGTAPRIFTWSNDSYLPGVVKLSGTVLSSLLYTLDPTNGSLKFLAPGEFNPPLTSYNDSDLTVVITHIGDQVTGLLPGSRLNNLNASAFTRGTLDSRRLSGLDHVGQVRINQPALVRPHLRLLSDGDHVTFYPEILNQPLQYSTEVYRIYPSQNISTTPILLGTKRGLMQTKDYSSAIQTLSWNIDRGVPVFLIDEILQADTLENHFHVTWMLATQGTQNSRVYSTSDLGLSWQVLQQPQDNNPIPMKSTAFYASSQRDDVQGNILVTKQWSSNLYMGTDRGLYTVNVPAGVTQANWAWSPVTNWYSVNDHTQVQTQIDPETIGKIWAVQEIVTVSTSTNQDTGEVTDTFNKTLYVGCDAGFFVGGSGGMKQITTDIVKGFLWIRDGSANNNENDLIWWTDTAVYITHTAHFYDDGQGNATWYNPLTQSFTAYTDVKVATTTEINLSAAPMTIDGVAISNGDRVLVKNQITDDTQNGIYVVGSPWTRATDMNLNGQLVPNKEVRVTQGTVNLNSIWYLPPKESTGYSLSSSIIWKIKLFNVFTDLGDHFNIVKARSGYSQYLVGSNNHFYVVSDMFTAGAAPTVQLMPWNGATQFPINDIVFTTSTLTSLGQVIVASNRGLWVTTPDFWTIGTSSPTWIRIHNEYSDAAQPSIYDAATVTPYTDISYTYDYTTQAFTFSSHVNYGQTFVYERDYINFYVEPWNSSNAEVIVYIGINVSDICYDLDATNGVITFSQSLTPQQASEVYITIIRNGAFISNVGKIPHEELPNSLATGPTQNTTLSAPLAPADMVIHVVNAYSIPINTQYIEIRSSTVTERIEIQIDPNTRVITLNCPRNSTYTFPANSSVYVVTEQSILGIEDLISLAENNQTYHLNSVGNENILQLGIAAQANYPNLFDNFTLQPTNSVGIVDRGPKDAIFLDFTATPSPLDTKATSSALYVGLDPIGTDQPIQPQAIYVIHNPSQLGGNMRIGTDEGIWLFENNTWKRESTLNSATRVYFIDSINNALSAGASTGLWNQAQNTWNFNPTYPQTIFDYSSGSWGSNGSYSAYGKSDGLAFVYQPSDGSEFISDHFDSLDNHRIYGLYHDQFIRISTDSNGNTTQTPTDALYLCTEIGLYGVTAGSRGGTYSSLLAGREMFGSTLNCKFYKIFRALPTPPDTTSPVPLQILTSNGLYRVRNWRWCDPDPTQPDLLNFYVEAHQLNGIACYCYCLATQSNTPTPPGLSKVFIGTSQGVYRSFNGASTFERCERIDGGNTVVYDLEYLQGVTFTDVYNSPYNNQVTVNVLLAGTELGMFYSIDDGDTWYRTDQRTSENYQPINYPSVITSTVPFNGGYLAQQFKTDPGQLQVTKVGIYVSVKNVFQSSGSQANSMNNTLTASIYATSGGIPTGSPITSSSGTITALIADGYLPSGWTTGTHDQLLASNVPYEGFWPLYVPATLPNDTNTYALVVRETVASGGEPCFSWEVSSLDNPYPNGEPLNGGTTPTWTELNSDHSQDFFFRIYLQANSVPIISYEPVGYKDGTLPIGFEVGDSNGVVIKDDGSLTTDFKFAISLTADSSLSQAWSDPNLRRKVKIQNIVDTLLNRTSTTVLAQPFIPSFVDWWQFGMSDLERSNGYTNDKASLDTYAAALIERGVSSDFYNTSNLAISGLGSQAIVEGILNANNNDESIIESIVSTIIQYHIDRSILRLSDIAYNYNLQPNAQITLGVHSGSNISDTTIYLSVPNGGIFTWSSLSFPFAQVLLQGVPQSSSTYTINPSSGSITFNTPLSSMTYSNSDLTVNLRIDWDGTSGGISTSKTARTYFITRWALSFTPVIFVFVDGDDNGDGTETANTVGLTASTAWDGRGVGVQTFALGHSNAQSGLRTICDLSEGHMFDIINSSDGQDWDMALNQLVHGGNYNLFSANWTRNYDYEIPTWIQTINATYTEGSGSVANAECLVQVRWSTDRLNFTAWQTIVSGTPLLVNQLVLVIQYKIIMVDGWNYTGSAYVPVKPVVSALYHENILPSTQYLITTPYAINGMLFEEILTAAVNVPSTAQLTWGVCRGNSTDWLYYEPIRNGRNGALSNRQASIQFTPAITRTNLSTVVAPGGSDANGNRVFQVLDSNNVPTSWQATDIVYVYFSGSNTPIDNTNGVYSLDHVHGLIYFEVSQPPSVVITVTIVTPPKLYKSIGESTTTVDYRTYKLIHGVWPYDSSIIVFANGNIVRGGYFFNNEEGTITFKQERNSSDIITVYVEPSKNFRIGVQLLNYSTDPITLNNFALMYTTRQSLGLLSQIGITNPPTVSGEVTFSPAQPTIHERLSIVYNYVSPDGNEERGTTTTWWLKRTGLSGSITDGNGYVQITAANSLPEYNDRTVERDSDVGTLFQVDDLVYVIVVPSDGYNFGIPVASTPITMAGVYPPYVWSAQINAVGLLQNPANSGLYYVSANTELRAAFQFNNGNGGGNQSYDGATTTNIVNWYAKDSNVSFYTGPRCPPNLVLSGMIINFIVTPYDGGLTGTPIESYEVTVK